MSDYIIKVENLGKKYRITHEQPERYVALRDVLARSAAGFASSVLGIGRHLFGLNGTANCLSPASDSQNPTLESLTSDLRPPTSEEFWALKDVSFEVKQGEVVGIIGRNGAGKSTLLKILSRITEPTEGRVRIKGRVASLLEVGTGFHPELTGRENIFLNGAVLGMTNAEIKRKFDEIVAFAEVEKFIDTPVKYYSSGMYVRLAFAVAAHLEPEILLLDEVLAVGDAAFQRKCLGKMGDVAKKGRTVLFVSHNLQMIDALCPHAALLQAGQIVVRGKTGDVLARYYESLKDSKVERQTAVRDQRYRRGTGAVRFTEIIVQDDLNQNRYRFNIGETVRFKLSYEVIQQVKRLYVIVMFRSAIGEPLTYLMHCVSEAALDRDYRQTVLIEMPALKLLPGTYPIYFWLGDEYNGKAFDVVDDLTSPLVIFSDEETQRAGLFYTESNLRILN
jgi:lipopolysaccharide transport system ATP-binding protein